MQSVSANHEPCKNSYLSIKSETLSSTNFSKCLSECSLYYAKNLIKEEYASFKDKDFKVDNLGKQPRLMSSEDSIDSCHDTLKTEDSPEKSCSVIDSKKIPKRDVFKDSLDRELPKTIKCTFFKTKKIGDIISTSRSGHLIEKKSESCFTLSKTLDEVKGFDSNDNIIKDSETPIDAMHDANDNLKTGTVFKGQETCFNDNKKTESSESDVPCGIGLLERLIRSHPVWFLPGIQRAGAVHLLQGKEEGNFIVRQSSQADTMAVSVRLPTGKGPYIEHYLIQAVNGHLSLESSENTFESIPSLIAHYCQCCDELPVQLTLPRTIREAKNRQQLSSLALLGQEFWRYPMANPRPPESRNSSPNSNKSDSVSSFDGVKKLVEKNNEIILDLVPLHRESQVSNLTTFKNSPTEKKLSLLEETKPKRPHTLDLISTNSEKANLLLSSKTPPQPPPRWTKPSNINPKHFSTANYTFACATDKSANKQLVLIEEGKSKELQDDSHCLSVVTHSEINSNFSTSFYNRNVSSPLSDQTDLKSFAFDKDLNSLKNFQEGKKTQLISPVSDNTNFVSKAFEKVNVMPTCTPIEKIELIKKSKKEKKSKESAHYQECDILESPTSYCYKSNVADKQSDYEDIWATDSFTTFKPFGNIELEISKSEERQDMKKPPDLLEKLETSSKFDKTLEKDLILKKDFFSSELDAEGAQNSPFYAEPADALVVRRRIKLSANKSRHSDPFSFNNWNANTNPYFSGGNVLDRIDSQIEMNDETHWKGKPSLSFDNIINLKKKETEGRSKITLKNKNAVKAKPVRPPKVDNGLSDKNQQYWAVDSSWEFIGNDENDKEGERRFPSIEQQMDSEERFCKCTVQEIITQRFPQFKISRHNISSCKSDSNKENLDCLHQTTLQKSESNKNGSRISAYDNLTSEKTNFLKQGHESERNSEDNLDDVAGICCNNIEDSKFDNESKSLVLSDTLRFKRRIDCGSVTEDNEDAQTIFSEPWDSSRWENLLSSSVSNVEERLDKVAPIETPLNSENVVSELFSVPEKTFRKHLKEELGFFVSLPGKSKEMPSTGASIRSYALHLASDKSTTFAQNIDNFIECTLESKELNPQVVMRNMRQFMSGMKNYLVKHGEREFEKQVEKERMKLKSTEFLNLDAILEGVMHKLVVRPLREHLYKLFVDEYIKSGAIQLLYENLNYAKTKSLHDLGLKTRIVPPSREALEVICRIIMKLQEVDSPLEKLDHLLACVSTVIISVKSSNQDKTNIILGADDILPLFVWVLVQSGFIAAEIEAEYMWGLLHPSLLSGEGCYYLTTLSSAVHVLKNLKSSNFDQSSRLANGNFHCGEPKFVLKIIVPDELHGSILTKTLPVKPNMTTKDVCKIIAHKIRITNPQDYGLFRLVDGEETLLNDNECPQNVKNKYLESGKHCTLAYKRIDAKIGWPRTA